MYFQTSISILILTLITCNLIQHVHSVEEEPVEYGVDVSFPIHNTQVSTNYPWLPHNVDPDHNPTPAKYKNMPLQVLGDRDQFYKDFMKNCSKKYPKPRGACVSTENDRVAMSLRQPQSMQNYTDIGFKKIKTPPTVWKLLQNFWEKNKDKKMPENWPKGNTYVNHWDSPTYMISVEDSRLRGGGSILKQAIWDAARDTIQEWTGQELTQCSLYGIRVYTEGAVLATHVDRLPLVSSAIVNVAQDVDEPWPIEVIGHDGKAYNVTMEPGDMVLYESHSVLHGRPFPMKGRYYANIFIHFEPVGHTLRHHEGLAEAGAKIDVHQEYRKAIKRGAGGHEADHDGLPSYILDGSDEAERWRHSHPGGERSAKQSFRTGSTAAHKAAQSGDYEALKEVIEALNEAVNQKDANGWTPLHEGSRAGHLEIVKYLVDKGANVNEQTFGGETPLYWAEHEHGESHPISEFLRSLGGIALGPEL